MSTQLRLDVAQLTDVGRKRPHNEDNMAYVIPKDPLVMARKGALFIVADGMGGHAAGEVASEIAVDTVSNVYYQDDNEDIAVSLLHAIKRANTLIHQRSAENVLRSGMGTTCVAAVLRSNIAYIANVGDSRAYMVRQGQVRQVSLDHSWVAEQVRAGLLTEEQARSHAQRNVITRCLGTQADVEIDVFPEPLEEGDTLVLCTDGLSGLINDDDLRVIVDQYVPQESVYHLVERANENGGSDNITAIVVRVQEVGWEPANTTRTLRPGGRDNNGGDATATLVMPGGSSTITMAPRVEDGRIPSAPLRLATGPLASSDRITAPQPAITRKSREPGRLLYPTLALFVLLIVVLVGGGAYFWLHLSSADVDTTIGKARTYITHATNEAANDPVAALRDLSQAQTLIRTSQASTLSDTQNKSLSTVQQNFTDTVKAAIRAYNQKYQITTLPCGSVATPADTVSVGSTKTVPESVARIVGPGPKQFNFALGQDHKLYQLDDNHSLVNGVNVLSAYSVLTIASDNTRLLALTSSPGQGANKPVYTLNLLTLDATNALKNTSNANIDPALTTQQNLVPSLLTAWGPDVYVVLTTQTSVNNAVILNYNTDNLNQNPTKMSISVTSNLLSVAAFPNHQLFLTENGGIIQGVAFNGNPTAHPVPLPIVVKDAVAPPLTVDAGNFTLNTAVPIPTPVAQTPSSALQLSQTSTLAAASFKGELHLYIMDGNRIIDLVQPADANPAMTGAATVATTATVTPNATATTNAASTATVIAGSPMPMNFNGQFTSATLFTGLKSVVADQNSTTPFLYLLNQSTQNVSISTFVKLDLGQKESCKS